MAPNTRSNAGLQRHVINLEEPKQLGRKEILYDGQFYDVTNWIDRHPGGAIIQYYAKNSEDATLAIQQFHKRSNAKVMGIMKQFKRRPAPLKCDTMEDVETLKKNQALSHDFAQLYREFESEGFFEPSLTHTVYRIVEVLVIGILAGYLLFDMGHGNNSLFTTSVGVFLFGIFGGRSGYLGHEGGHRSLTGNRKVDDLIQTFSFGLGVGLSGSCWNSQAKLSLVLDTMLVLLAWKFWLHPLYAYRKEKYLELLCMCVHSLYVSLFIGFWPYVFCLYLGSIYLFGNYVLSHSHLPVTEKHLHWVEYALIHTQDIDDSWFVDWWMGYLNCQIEHHLFPTMPQFRGPKAKARVKALAQKHNIPYLCHSYFNVAWQCLKNLQEISDHLKNED